MFGLFKKKQETPSIFNVPALPYYEVSKNNYIKYLSSKLPLASACIGLKASKVRTTKYKFTRNGQEVEVPEYFKKVNYFQSLPDLLELIVWHLESLGHSYILRLGNGKEGFYLLSPNDVQLYTIADLFPSHYEYQVRGGERVRLELSEVAHFYYPSPSNPSAGLGVVERAEVLLQKNLNRDVYSSQFYKNGTVLSGVFSSDAASISTEQRQRMKASMLEELQGTKNFFKVFFAWAGMRFYPTATTQRDAQDVEQAKLTRDDILAVFGVPGALLGFTDGVNFSNAEIQERIFISNTLLPLLERLEELINKELISHIDKDLKFEFIKPQHENLNLKSSWVSKTYQDGIIDKEEYARLMGVSLGDGVTNNEQKSKELISICNR